MMAIELAFVLFCGLVFGSFVTCASWRLPRGEDAVCKPSYCPNCNTTLGFKALWPVISWLAHKGKCRYCHTPISVRYPLIELATAAVFLLIYSRYGISVQGVALALFAVALLVMIVIDFEHYMIPDEIHLFLLPLGIGYHYYLNTPFDEPLYGLLLCLAVGLGLHHGYRALRGREGLGYGDVKFLFVCGLWVGLTSLPPFLFFAGALGVANGLVWRALGLGPRFPFGPALAASLFICVAFPETTDWFWDLFSPLQAL